MDFELGLQIHKKLFPKATPYSQLTQLNEELGELERAETKVQMNEETGDVLVVAVSLLRFKQTENIGNDLLKHYYYECTSKAQELRMGFFEKSIKKCIERVSEERYKFVDGLYKRSKVNIKV